MTRQGPVRPPYHCTRRFHLLDLHSGYFVNCKICSVPAEAERNVEIWLGAVALLARRPLDANPDAKHPGKAREILGGK